MNTSNVTAGVANASGCVYIAAVGATAPTDATTALPTATWTELGYISDEGLVNSNSPSNTDVKEWGGHTVLSVLSEKPDTFKFKLLEVLNIDVLQIIYGTSNASVDSDGMITVHAKAEQPTNYMWCFDMELSTGQSKRVVIPDAAITAMEDIQYVNNDATGFGITITAYPDSSGETHTEFIE